MKLSVVIVNYNVCHFLDQCVQSVLKAMTGIEGEVFVVDNNSVDGSVEMIREKYPEVKLIANKENTGFSKANNQAIRIAQGEYVLLLNPDTVVEEDTFSTCIRFMDAHADAGALGVKLIDGKGNYLPESKRGLPTPSVSFYKIFGLSKLCPKSKTFGKYHLGYLDKEETNEIEILSGAFMFMRKTALDKAGYLDEAFFMYGEDIDLSYRISLAGYKVYYHPETRIIHYRGESTKKSSINYVFVFYQAMIIFANKHFSQKNARLFSLLIRIAVYLRAAFSVLSRIVAYTWLPLMDACVMFVGMYFLKDYWAERSGIFYPMEFLWVAVPLYIISWIGFTWISGGYDRPLKILKTIRGLAIGTLLILVVYGLLDEAHRYSRFLTLVGAGWAAVAATGIRMLYNLVRYKSFFPEDNELKRILIVGEETEAARIAALLNQSPVKTSYVGIVSPKKEEEQSLGYAGSIGRLREMVEVFGINELIFCGKDLSSAQIMDQMMLINHPELEYKIAPPESLFIIGSNSIQTSGELYTIGLNAVDKPSNRRKKRLFDILVSCAFIGFFPITLLFIRSGGNALSNAIAVLRGKKTWIGYAQSKENASLPKLPSGVLHPLDPYQRIESDEKMRLHSNLLYAKDYRIQQDFLILLHSLQRAGRKQG
jgi:GT2 family glycosyltransferase